MGRSQARRSQAGALGNLPVCSLTFFSLTRIFLIIFHANYLQIIIFITSGLMHFSLLLPFSSWTPIMYRPSFWQPFSHWRRRNTRLQFKFHPRGRRCTFRSKHSYIWSWCPRWCRSNTYNIQKWHPRWRRSNTYNMQTKVANTKSKNFRKTKQKFIDCIPVDAYIHNLPDETDFGLSFEMSSKICIPHMKLPATILAAKFIQNHKCNDHWKYYWIRAVLTTTYHHRHYQPVQYQG